MEPCSPHDVLRSRSNLAQAGLSPRASHRSRIDRLGQVSYIPADHRTPAWGPQLHSWSTAFPDMPCLDVDKATVSSAHLIFTGDFIGGVRAGSVEGATLSGFRAAESLRDNLGLSEKKEEGFGQLLLAVGARVGRFGFEHSCGGPKVSAARPQLRLRPHFCSCGSNAPSVGPTLLGVTPHPPRCDPPQERDVLNGVKKVAVVQWNGWYNAWQQRMAKWADALPAATVAKLDVQSCLSALSLHLASRLDLRFRAQQPSSWPGPALASPHALPATSSALLQATSTCPLSRPPAPSQIAGC